MVRFWPKAAARQVVYSTAGNDPKQTLIARNRLEQPMRNLFTTYLVVNLMLEGIAAVTLVGAGLGLFTIAQLESGMWSMNYGFAAIAIASALFWVWPHRSKREVVGPVLGILLAFHALVSVSFAIQGAQVQTMVVHGIMALLGIFLYARRSAWCQD